MRLRVLVFSLFLFLRSSLIFAQIDVEHIISIGKNALYFKDYHVSIAYFNQAIANRPWLADPYFFRAVAKVSLEDYIGAEKDASTCLDRNPFLSKGYFLRAVARQNLDSLHSAIDDYKRGLDLDPSNEGGLYNLALAEAKVGDYESASHRLNSLLQVYPKNSKAYNILALIALEQKDSLEAIRLCEQSLHYNAIQSTPYKTQAFILMNQGRALEAERLMNRALKIDPYNASLYGLRAMLRYQQNKLRGAMSDYSDALEYNPNYLLALYNRALLNQQVGAYHSAAQDWDVLLRINPNDYPAYYNRAIVNLELGKRYKVLADLSIVLKQYPDFINAYLLRSKVYNQLGDKASANRDYYKAVSLKTNTKYKAQLRKIAKTNRLRHATRSLKDKTIEKYSLLLHDSINTKSYKAFYDDEAHNQKSVSSVFSPREPFYLSFFKIKVLKKGEKDTYYYDRTLDDFLLKNKFLNRELFLECKSQSLSIKQINNLNATVQREIAQGQDSTSYYFLRGIALSLLQDEEQAEQDFNRCLQISQNALFYFSRSITYLKLSRLITPNKGSQSKPKSLLSDNKVYIDYKDKALRDLDACIKIAPTFSYAYFNKAIILAQRGQKDFALENYSSAIKINPNFAEAYFNRALIYLYKGLKKEGLRELSKAGELGVYDAYTIIKQMS